MGNLKFKVKNIAKYSEVGYIKIQTKEFLTMDD